MKHPLKKKKNYLKPATYCVHWLQVCLILLKQSFIIIIIIIIMSTNEMSFSLLASWHNDCKDVSVAGFPLYALSVSFFLKQQEQLSLKQK